MTIEQRVGEALRRASERRPLDVDALWERTREQLSGPAPRRSWLPVLAAAVAVVTVGTVLWPAGEEPPNTAAQPNTPPTPAPSAGPSNDPNAPATVLSTRGYQGSGPVVLLRGELDRVPDTELVLMDVRPERVSGEPIRGGYPQLFTYGYACPTVEGPVLCVTQLRAGSARIEWQGQRSASFADPFGRPAAAMGFRDLDLRPRLQLRMRGVDDVRSSHPREQVFEGRGWPQAIAVDVVRPTPTLSP